MPNFLSYVDSGRFEELFEELGWGYVPRGVSPITVQVEEGRPFTAQPVADQAGLRVWVVEADELPTPTEQRIIDAEVQKASQLRLLIFTDGIHQSWRWPRRGATAATNSKLLHHRYTVGDEDLAEDLARRLAMIELPIGETIGILEIQERMASAFNDEAVKRSRQASNHMQVMNQQLLDAGCDTSTASSLLVRLLFLFFGDDTNMWPDNTFQKWVLHHTTAETLSDKLTELFEVVCDPELDLAISGKGRYADTEYANFRRIDGMYKERIDLPPVSEQFRQQVLKAGEFDWGRVNPDIFGAMFQQLVDLDELRGKGEHYTSEENILKVIEPLFLDDLRARFEDAYDDRTALISLQNQIAGLAFLDPACGCGNFLIQAYKHLRGLEFEIIARAEDLELAEINAQLDLTKGKRDSERQRNLRQRLQEIESHNAMQFADEALRKSKMSMRQFYGIEINEWPAKVASTAMLLVDHLCNQAFGQSVVRLPIEETPEIVNANALRTDWADVVPADDCDYIIGNPPFVGYSRLDAEQKEDRASVFGKDGGLLDFVASWHRTAAEFLNGHGGEIAFVSTNSICQGQQVTPLWKPIFDMGYRINFAHRSFVWNTESEHQANVYCVITSFSQDERATKRAWDYTTRGVKESQPAQLNGYLADAPAVFITRRSKPISDVPPMAKGFQPTDNGWLLLSPAERDQLLRVEPNAEPWIRPFSMGEEFVKGIDRYCLWLADIAKDQLEAMPAVSERVRQCQNWRLEQTATGDAYKLADRPHLLRPTSKFKDGTYIGIPVVTSERRRYVPFGFVDDGMIPGNQFYFVPTASLFVFGVLMSQAHNAWMRTVAGRLKSDYRYANTIVYNNFVFLETTPPQRDEIERSAQAVLDARGLYPDASLAKLYDPENESKYPELTETHRALDRAVERAYGWDFDGLSWDEKETHIVSALFELYSAKVRGEYEFPSPPSRVSPDRQGFVPSMPRR